METESNKVECPICSQMFEQEIIETHADMCLLGLTEKPLTRNKNNKSPVFFNKKNTKRGAKNEINSISVSNKKIKFESDLDTKENYEKTGCSTKNPEVIDGLDMVKKDDVEVDGILLSPKSDKISSFFGKKSVRQKKKEEKDKKELPSSIDLTDCPESDSQPDKNMDVVATVENVVKKSEDILTTPVSKENIEDTLDSIMGTSIRNIDDPDNFINSPSLVCDVKRAKVKERSKTLMDNFFPNTSMNLDFESKDEIEVEIPTPPPIDSSEIDESPTVTHCTNTEDMQGVNKTNCNSSKEKPDAAVVKQAVCKNEYSTPPLTTFQQELFNMSKGSDTMPASPPAKSNSQSGDHKVPSTQVRGMKGVSKSGKGVCHMKAAENVKDKVVEPKKENKIILGKLPLAEQMRPKTLDDYVGQVAVGTQKLLKELFYNDRIPSMILWGPPGCGKTSLAHIISQQCKSGQRYRYVSLSATMSGVKDVKEAVQIAKNEKQLRRKHTVLFIDEVHRFNKMQQDSFLPHIEDGTIVLIGATTENPSFHLNNALTSRCRIVVLNSLNVESIANILRKAAIKLGGTEKAEQQSKSTDFRFILEDGVINLLAEYSNGDARIALTSLDLLLQAKLSSNDDSGRNHDIPIITCQQIKEELKRGHVNYDKGGDEHYDIISAFQKSIRGGNQDAAIYWLARMLEGGEDPLFIARRLIVIASEDIGMADSNGLNLAVSCYQSCQFIGMPECGIVLAHVTTYLSNAPKSIASYSAYNKAKSFIKEYSGSQPSVPLHLRNASTKLMKDLGFGKGYKYSPNFKDGEGEQDYLPKDIVGTKFFS